MRQRTAQGVFDDLAVLRSTEENADGGVLMRFLHIAVEGFEIEAQLAEVFGFKAFDLQLQSDEAVHTAMEEKQVEREVALAHLERHLGPDEAEVAAEFGDEFPEFAQESAVEVGFRVIIGKPRNSKT